MKLVLLMVLAISLQVPLHGAYQETNHVSQSLSIGVKVVGSYDELQTGYSNISKVSVTSGETWINLTQGCGEYACPGISLDCGGTFYDYASPPTYYLPYPCFVLGFLFDGSQLPLGSQGPSYTIQRVLYAEDNLSGFWTVGSGQEISNVSTTSIPVGQVVSSSYNFTFPNGLWSNDLAVNDSSQQDVVTYPTGNGFGFQAGPGNFTVSVIGTPSNASGKKLITPNTVPLVMGNVTGLGGDSYESTALWPNPFPENFSGYLRLEGTWIASATDVRIFGNGNVLGGIPQGDTILVPVSVPQGATIFIKADFTVVSQVSPISPFSVFNGFSLNLANTMFLAGAVLSGVLAYGWSVGKVRARTVFGALSFFVLLGVWLSI